MGCLTFVPRDILINGSPLDFFQAQCGIHQGFHLSPLLFLLVAKGLSLMIKDAFRRMDFQGLFVS